MKQVIVRDDSSDDHYMVPMVNIYILVFGFFNFFRGCNSIARPKGITSYVVARANDTIILGINIQMQIHSLYIPLTLQI